MGLRPDFLDEYIERLDELDSCNDETAEDVERALLGLLDALGLERIGFWSSILLDSGMPLYHKKDESLFEWIDAPDNSACYGGNDDECDGFFFGIEKKLHTLYLVGINSSSQLVDRISITDAYRYATDMRIDFGDVLRVIRGTLQINLDNEIPIKLWPIAHCSEIHPYNWGRPDNSLLCKINTAGVKDKLHYAFSEVDVKHLDLRSCYMGKGNTPECMCAGGSFEKITMPSSRHYFTSLGNAFQNCRNLREIDFNGMQAPELQNISFAFHNCENILSIDLSSLCPKYEVDITAAFRDCKMLESLNLSHFIFPEANRIFKLDFVFEGCTNLKTIYMYGCTRTSIDTIEGALKAAGLANVNIIREENFVDEKPAVITKLIIAFKGEPDALAEAYRTIFTYLGYFASFNDFVNQNDINLKRFMVGDYQIITLISNDYNLLAKFNDFEETVRLYCIVTRDSKDIVSKLKNISGLTKVLWASFDRDTERWESNDREGILLNDRTTFGIPEDGQFEID